MNLSFYTGSVGAMSQQNKLDIIANNIANINTDGYKSKSSTFSGLMYANMNAPKNAQTGLNAGVGVKIEKTDIDMKNGAMNKTDGPLDFNIVGEGLFAIQMPGTQDVSYTRDGSFIMSKQQNGEFHLSTKDGYQVLGKDKLPIIIKEDESLEDKIGVFTFDNYNGMLSVGANRLKPEAKNGVPKVNESAQIQKGGVETSNVDFSKEVSKMIETQRAYQFALRMVTTSDEVEGIINSLR